jgi:universal stress protein A
MQWRGFKMYRHVLVATDLQDENRGVVNKGLALAKHFSAKLSLVHVVEPLPGYGYAYVGVADIEGQLLREAKQALTDLAQGLSIAADDCFVEVGPTKTQIMKVAQAQGVDLIILGSHGRHGFAELLGSTAHAVVHSAKCDVMTVRIRSAVA